MQDWKILIQQRLGRLSADPGHEAQIIEEMAQHLEDCYQNARARGLTEAEARARACEELHSARAARHQIRRLKRSRPRPVPPETTGGWARGLLSDVAYAARVMRFNPSLSVFATLVIAIGICSTTTIFSVVNGVLLQSLPYPDGDRIVVLGHPASSGRPGNLGFATLADWRSAATTFEQISAVRAWSPTLVDEEGADRVAAVRVSANYFDVLGVGPETGRSFLPEEDAPGLWRVVILSFPFWRDRLGADPDIVGRSIQLSDRAYQVVGIMPEGFDDLLAGHLYHPPQVWAPLGYEASLPYACRGCQHIRGVGRLAPEATLAGAGAELRTIQAGLIARHPGQYSEDETGVVESLRTEMTASVRPAIRVLVVAVMLVFVISCANVANLFLARSIERRREMSLRAAIGAGRVRLIRLLLVESLLLAGLGGAVGLAAAPWAMRGLLGLGPDAIQRSSLGVEWSVVLFAAAASLLTGVLFGIGPALASVRGDLASALRQDGRATSDRGLRRGQRALVVADLTLALVLLCGSLLMLQSVDNLLRVDPGFEAAQLLTAQMNLLGQRYLEEEAVLAAVSTILEKVESVPGVVAASATSQLPLSGNRDAWGVHRKDAPEANPAEAPYALLFRVSAGYLPSMKIRLQTGRLLDAGDRSESLPVMVVSETMAESIWPGESAVGKQLRIGAADDGPWYTVVGIVDDVRSRDLHSSPEPQMYVPLEQNVSAYLTLVARTGNEDLDVSASIRDAVAEAAPGVPVYGIEKMRRYVDRVTADRRFVSRLLSAFALIAVVLTSAGIYGLASFFVQQRTKELGVRAALGADRVENARLILGHGLRLAVLGLGGGWVLVALSGSLLERLLFDVSAFDVRLLAFSSLVLVAVLVLSHLFPVMRAVRVDPAMALRGE